LPLDEVDQKNGYYLSNLAIEKYPLELKMTRIIKVRIKA
jgi:hypothetical protein